MSHVARAVGFSLCCFLLPAASQAQMVGGQMEEIESFPTGWKLAAAGDVDQDGVPDLVIGDPEAVTLATNAGEVVVRSGRDGSILWRATGVEAHERLGSDVAGGGDVDGDGWLDFAATAPFTSPGGMYAAGSAFVYSGRTGRLLWRFDGERPMSGIGLSVDIAGDINGDGFADVVVGSAWSSRGPLTRQGVVDVYSGRDGTRLFEFFGELFDALGTAIATVADVDGDGHDEVLAGAPQFDGSRTGYVDLYSGRDGSRLWRAFGLTSGVQGGLFGNAVASAGDIDRDGVTDVIVGAPTSRSVVYNSVGRADVLSGRDGSVLFRLYSGGGGIRFGSDVSGAGDIDQDGFSDLLVGAYGNTNPSVTNTPPQSVHIFSGRDGRKLWQLDERPSISAPIMSVAGVGDMDGNGFDDIGIAIGFFDPIKVFRLDPFMTPSAFELDAATGGGIDYSIRFPQPAHAQSYLVLMSASGTGPLTFGVEIPLTIDSLMLASATGQLGSLQTGFAGVLSNSATAEASLTLPSYVTRVLAGMDLHLAAVALLPAGPAFYSSSAIRLSIVP